VVLVRVKEGRLQRGTRIRFWSNGQVYVAESLGVFTPKPVEVQELSAGEVGFIAANIKKIADAQIGDTVTEDARPAVEPLAGVQEIKPMVFAGLYPVDADN